MIAIRTWLVLLSWLALGSTSAWATDLAKIDRSIAKEPTYRSKAPKYGLLVFGPDAAHRVWLVHDGDTLYVDRNGNGDLTEPGEKIRSAVEKSRTPEEAGYTFEIGDISIGGKVHKALTVYFQPLKTYAISSSFKDFAPLHAALKADPKALVARVDVEVESARLKGGSIGGRLSYQAGFYDGEGMLQFADRPAAAPVIHIDGPLQITFFGWRPTLHLAREDDLVLVVGTPGRGPGTFAMLAYDQAIPENAHPQVDIAFAAERKDGSPVKERFELKRRC